MNTITAFEKIKHTLTEHVSDQVLKSAMLKMLDDNSDNWRCMPASVSHHHSFPGGLSCHVAEVLSNIVALYTEAHRTTGNVPFSLDDALLVGLVHDLDKLTRYVLDTTEPTKAQVKFALELGINLAEDESKTSISSKIDLAKDGKEIKPRDVKKFKYSEENLPLEDSAIVLKMCIENGIMLRVEHLSAVALAHGGWSSLVRANPKVSMTPLATILHCADMQSAFVQKGNGIATDFD